MESKPGGCRYLLPACPILWDALPIVRSKGPWGSEAYLMGTAPRPPPPCASGLIKAARGGLLDWLSYIRNASYNWEDSPSQGGGSKSTLQPPNYGLGRAEQLQAYIKPSSLGLWDRNCLGWRDLGGRSTGGKCISLTLLAGFDTINHGTFSDTMAHSTLRWAAALLPAWATCLIWIWEEQR